MKQQETWGQILEWSVWSANMGAIMMIAFMTCPMVLIFAEPDPMVAFWQWVAIVGGGAIVTWICIFVLGLWDAWVKR